MAALELSQKLQIDGAIRVRDKTGCRIARERRLNPLRGLQVRSSCRFLHALTKKQA